MGTDGALNPLDSYFNSCGDQCGAARSTCVHFCDQVCHPGPCENCTLCATARIDETPGTAHQNGPPTIIGPSITSRTSSDRPWTLGENSLDLDLQSDIEQPPSIAHDEVQSYPTGTFCRLFFCLVWTTCVAYATFRLTMVVLEPHKHPRLVENEGALDALWIFFASAAFLCSCMNAQSMAIVKPARRIFVHNARINPFWASLFQHEHDRLMARMFIRFSYVIYVFVAGVWILGPGLAYVKLPFFASHTDPHPAHQQFHRSPNTLSFEMCVMASIPGCISIGV